MKKKRKKLKEHRLKILQRAEDNLNFMVEMINQKARGIELIRKLGYSKKKSIELFNEIIQKL